MLTCGITTAYEEWRDTTSRFVIQPIYPGQEAAIKNKLPWLTVSYCPGFIKTADDSPYPVPNLGPHLNRLAWSVAEWLIRKWADPVFNEFIASVGGRKRKLVGIEGMYSRKLNLLAASPHISPPPSDLPKNHRYTGAWFLDEPEYEVPSALQDFFNSGARPVIISFGSMGGTQGAETTRILIEAVETELPTRGNSGGVGQFAATRAAGVNLFRRIRPTRFPLPSRDMCGASRRCGHYRVRLPRRSTLDCNSTPCRSAVLG